MSDPLARLKRAAAQREEAAREYRAALLAARAAGHTYDAIAAAAGICKQAARQHIGRLSA